MLDLKTILVVTFAIATLQAVAWTFVWLTWRHLYELKFLAASSAAIALGLFLMIVRGAEPAGWSIVLANSVIKLGLVLLAEGLARFLGQPRYSWIGVSLLALHVISWSVVISHTPQDVAIRVHLSTIFTVVMMSVICLGLLRDRTQPVLLRWITISLFLGYMASSILQSMLEASLPLSDTLVLANHNSWYLLQATLFQIAFFACMLFMVSTRLSRDLQDKNQALAREVAMRKDLEARLSASFESERALREEQADFMRVVGHEFRTPLAIIRNATDMIAQLGHRSPEATKQRVAAIAQATDRLVQLIERFMAKDRDPGFQPEPVRIGSLIGDVRLHFELTRGGDRLAFTIEDGEELLFADPSMIETVLINLIDNALKYSPKISAVEIDVRKRGREMVIRVRDHGIGIAEADLHKVGRRFFRASNTQAGTGTGLGLYMTRKLLTYHGGRLQLVRNEDRGMTASVSLPLPQEPACEELAEEITA